MSNQLQVKKEDIKLVVGSGGISSNSTWILLRDIIVSIVDFIKTRKELKHLKSNNDEAIFELGEFSDDETFTDSEWATKSLLNHKE